MRTRHAGLTDTGLCRSNNEDEFLAVPELGLFVVCDGVGGRAKGEVASRVTAEQIRFFVESETALLESARAETGELPGPILRRLRGLVRGAIQNACYMVHGMGLQDPEQRGMSTTASVLLITGHTGIVGQVGDSRVYLGRAGEVSQVTEDHTVVQHQVKAGRMTPEEARRSRLKNIITRAVGQKEYVNPDITELKLEPGDRVLLCTDGLHDYLDRGVDVHELFNRELEAAPTDAIRMANERGGEDNITALFVELHDESSATG